MKKVLLMLLQLLPCTTDAQRILGVVTDTAKEPLLNISVTILQNNNFINRTSTDFDGKYDFKLCDSGLYDLTASSIGFKTIHYCKISTSSYRPTHVSIRMEPGSVTDTIIKNYETPIVKMYSAYIVDNRLNENDTAMFISGGVLMMGSKGIDTTLHQMQCIFAPHYKKYSFRRAWRRYRYNAIHRRQKRL